MLLEVPLSCLPSAQLPGLELEEPDRSSALFWKELPGAPQGRVRDQVLAYCMALRLTFLVVKSPTWKEGPLGCLGCLSAPRGSSARQSPEAEWLLQPQSLPQSLWGDFRSPLEAVNPSEKSAERFS